LKYKEAQKSKEKDPENYFTKKKTFKSLKKNDKRKESRVLPTHKASPTKTLKNK